MTPNQVNRAHWPTKENRQSLSSCCIFLVHGENGLGWPQMGPGGFFPYESRTCRHFGQNGFEFLEFSCFCFFGSQISGFRGPQISKFPDRGLGQAWADLDLLEHSSAVAPRHSRTTKLVRSEELGQYRENPICASLVWVEMALPFLADKHMPARSVRACL